MRVRNIVAGLGLLCGAVGCHHTAGFCDCSPPITPCCIYGLHPAADYSVVNAVATTESKPTAPAPKAVDAPHAAPAKPATPPVPGALSADTIKE